ncbi:hypothetical protein QV06_09515 [Gallibacterium genomosp. 3]|uniref:Uncharacterized protein n=1 Tax=Gallibacterium genomosp. 3 TaxID=505345 RepID=A0A1A7PPN5_9PAST|nr:DUF945 family protein [Gallibacterium genomosp. 3]OBX03677.1 hypothetical protein QV06_09515 [Gallibacterium genomosp. 3]
MQKKWAIVPAAIIVLGGVWVGNAWYTGSQIEKNYPQVIQKINDNGIIKIENVKLERHLFSSDMQYDLQIGKLTMPLHSKIYHGALPLNLLQQFNFKPVAASTETTLIKNEKTASIFNTFPNGQPFVLNVDVGYQQQVDINLLVNAGSFKDEKSDTQSNWSSSKYQLQIDEKNAIKYLMELDHFDMYIKENKQQQPTKLVINKFLAQGALKLTEWKYLATGKGESSIKEFSVFQPIDEQSNTIITVNYQDQTNNYELTKDQDFYSISNSAQTKNLLFSSQSSAINFATNSVVKLNHLKGEAVSELIKAILEQDKLAFNQAIKTLVDNQPQLLLSPIEIYNNQDKFVLNADIKLAKADLNSSFQNGHLSEIFDQFKFNFSLDKTFINNLLSGAITFINSTNAQNKIDIDEVQQNIQRALKQQVIQGVLTETDKSYLLNFEEKEDNFYLNQQKIPQEAILFGLLQLFSGS